MWTSVWDGRNERDFEGSINRYRFFIFFRLHCILSLFLKLIRTRAIFQKDFVLKISSARDTLGLLCIFPHEGQRIQYTRVSGIPKIIR